MTDLGMRCHSAALELLALLTLLAPALATATVVDAINTVRDGGCGGGRGRLAPLRENPRLDEVAHHLSRGTQLAQAEQLASYHAVSSFAVSISNVQPSGDVTAIVARQFCPQVTNPAFREIGTWREGSTVWIALAEPFRPPAPQDLGAASRTVLRLTNQARAAARRCGRTPFAPAPPLTVDTTLGDVALAYARDMAAFGYMNHTGRDGSSPQARVTRSGYRWSEVGENLASGVMTPEEVVAGWLSSPEHCANLMDPGFRQMGVAFAVNPRNERGVYWAMEFGTPR
jgi:uncharacterized protein YkwD